MPKPNLFIVGIPKAGTTSMHNYLAQHPEIFMSPYKEPYYFASDLNFSWRVRELSQYLSLFNFSGTPKYIGESSPGYMYSKVAAKQIKEFCPTARIIVLLRNPIDMLYSLHGQLLLTAHEDILDFEEALSAQEDRRQGKRIPERCDESKILLYFDIALYSSQLKRYLDLFGSENVHIVLFEDFSKNTAIAYRQTLKFLEVDPNFEARFDVHNRAKSLPNLAARSFLFKYPALKTLFRKVLPLSWVAGAREHLGRLTQPQRPKNIDLAVRVRLRQQFQSEIEELSHLLDRDLTHWLN